MIQKLLVGIAMLGLVSGFGVTLEWDANSETNVAGYRVYVGSVSRVYDRVLDVGNTTLSVIDSTTFQVGRKCYFAVTAYDTEGLESDFSDEVIWQRPLVLDLTMTISEGLEGAVEWSEDLETWTYLYDAAGPVILRFPIDSTKSRRFFRFRVSEIFESDENNL